MQEYGAHAVATWRSNTLDQLTCMVRDCFADESLGFPVDEDGQRIELCFERRQRKDVVTKAWFNTDVLVAMLQARRTKLRNSPGKAGAHIPS